MTKTEILEQVRLANAIVQDWPEWKRNILEHSLQPTNSVARTPVDNRVSHSQPALSNVSVNSEESRKAE